MSRILAALVALMALATPQRTIAQGVGFPASGKPKFAPRDLDPQGKRNPLQCYLHFSAAPFRAAPAADAEVLKTGAFLEGPFYVAARDASKQFVLLADGGQRDLDGNVPLLAFHGWVDRRHCLAFTGFGPQSLKDPRTLIYRKAMLVNRFAGGQNAAELGKPVPFLSRPDLQGQSRGARSLFEIYYVFDERDGYLFLGTEPLLDQPGARDEVLLGWIPKRRACLWNTREAVEFNKRDLAQRTRPCRIFQTRAELEDYLKLKGAPHIAEEDLNVKGWKYFQPRFPLVDDDDSQYQGKALEGTKIYKIGVIGDVWNVSGDTPRVLVTAQDRRLAATRGGLEGAGLDHPGDVPAGRHV